MFRYPFYFVLLASLRHTLGSPPNKSSREVTGFEEDQEMDECFIHVRIQSCHEAMDIQLRLVGGTNQVPLQELKLDISEEGNKQDVCLSVPCQSGQLTEFMKLKATSIASDDFDIVVSPETLETTFGGLHYDSEECFGGMKTPAEIIVTCKKKLPSVHVQNYETSDRYNNEYDEPLDFTCGSHKAINSIKSRHNNGREDRQFGLTCHTVTSCAKPFTPCYWTEYVNQWRETLSFTCAENHVITGMYSTHDNSKEDRRWKFQCCYAENYVTKSCSLTETLNSYDKEFSFNTENRLFIGMYSYYDKYKKDRLFKVAHCEYVKE